MSLRVIWTEPAKRDLKRLDVPAARRVGEAIVRLAETEQGDVKKLRAPLPGYRLRVGDWRVSFERDRDAGTLTVRRVRHRRDAYR